MLKFAVCPHDTETKLIRKRWKKINEKFASFLHQPVQLVYFENYIEERQRIKKERFDVYYANPIIAYKLYKQGYRPIGKRKEEQDRFVIIGSKNSKSDDEILLVMVYLETHILPILNFEEIDLLRAKIVYVHSQREIYEKVKRGEADLGIIYQDIYDSIEDINKVPVYRYCTTNFSHFFMALEDVADMVANALEKIEDLDFQKVSDSEFLESYRSTFPIKPLLRIRELFDLSKAVYNIPFIGVIVYQEHIVYANRYIQNLLGYSLEELQKYNITDFVEDQYKDDVQNTVQRRLRGEYFAQNYLDLKIQTKSGSFRYVIAFSNTITYQDEFSGIIFLIDVTKEVHYQQLYKALRNINRAITSVMSEEELFETVCQTVIQELDIALAWIAIPDQESKSFKRRYACGDLSYLDEIQISFDEKIPLGKGPTGMAFRNAKIQINENTLQNRVMKPWRESLLRHNFHSSAAIPIKKYGKIVAILNLYATQPYFFSEEHKTLLEELEHDLGFALEKIEHIQQSYMLRKALEKSDEWVLVADEQGKIIYVNEFVEKVSGYTKDEILGKNPNLFKSGYQPVHFYKKLWSEIIAGNEFEAIFVNRAKGGKLFYLDQKIVPIVLPGASKRFIALGRDITKEKELSQELEHIRYHDVITDLYNFNGFKFKVEELLEQTKQGEYAALAVIDIDRFSYFNKIYGISTGDEILRRIATMLLVHFGKDTIIAKTAGDEFSLFFPNIHQEKQLFVIKFELENIFRHSFRVEENVIKLSVRGGIALYPSDAKSFSELYENAFLALKKAKQENQNIIFFNPDIEKGVRYSLQVQQLLAQAIENKEFLFHYQPYFEAKTQKLAGFEALVRIKDVHGNIHYPNDFIDYLEESTYLKEFESWALQEVAEKINQWNLPISINISARTFQNPEFPIKIKQYTKMLKKPMKVEITERLFMKDIQFTKKLIELLKMSDTLEICVDDFGTGYSSLSYLEELEVDVLKIDISFVRKMVHSSRAKAVVQGIISIAKALHMKTIAEGVETKEQYELLRDFGVDYIQGFYFAKPMWENEVIEKYFT
ncbi:EAL domain-containing protein [Nitratiruptor sp. SB155-2]|uniref:EAL domain-containing protein n=1 Tax=Nitratiruptor sp. (strain SB155-2) TaxID=387092 RepID=UPI0001586F15|nr:EAL domain-containing protein [Nitratiruptor sp. SB155-2]BAF69251.1 conserved hypothetical protein [Nitratiruptor sp. SB155-2]